MEQTAAQPRNSSGNRMGANPKTLHRKAMQKAAAGSVQGESLEDVFPQPLAEASPTPAADSQARAVEGHVATPAPAQPLILCTWSDQDEQNFKILAERRRQSGYRARGKDMSAQRLTTGKIVPNDGTVMATIVALVRTAGVVSRSDLLDLIATTTFAHAKAKPTDREWAQNYVAGALRGGFIVFSDGGETVEPATKTVLGEFSPDAFRKGV